jgi:O-6-methylguanine DNA methyltransferase
MEDVFFCRTNSPAGRLLFAASARGLLKLEFDRGTPGHGRPLESWKESAVALDPYVSQLEEYFAGQRREFSFSLDLRGTEFQLKCWRALLEIPYAETRTYRDIAQSIGHPRSFRAVGMSNNRNPVAIVVPCHRVIASDGSLCGYGGGLDTKRQLLDLEQARFDARLPLGIGA